MNKIYYILCVLLVLVLLIVGCISLFDQDVAFSEQENRNLKTFPRITVSGLIDGSFTDQLLEYYADTFPGREGMLAGDTFVSTFFTFRQADADASEPHIVAPEAN